VLTSRERLRRCFFHQELDRPAVYCRPNIPPGDATYDPLRKLLQEKADLKFIWSGSSLVPGPKVTTNDEPYSDDFVRRIERMDTPAGQLVCSRLVGLRNQPGMIEKHFLTTREDAQRYLSLPAPEIGGDVAPFFQLERDAADRGLVIIALGMNPAGRIAELFGSENFALMSLTDRDILHALCEREMRVILELVDFLLDRGVCGFFAMAGEEYVAPPLHSPADFQDFNVRYDKPIIDRVHEAGGKVHIHCHGPIKTVLDAFLEMGVDVLHPLEPPPMGDIEPGEAKQRVRGRMCIEGNIQIGDMYEKSPEQIRGQTAELIEAAFDDRRDLIVCPTASPYIPRAGGQCIEQFRAMIDTVLHWR